MFRNAPRGADSRGTFFRRSALATTVSGPSRSKTRFAVQCCLAAGILSSSTAWAADTESELWSRSLLTPKPPQQAAPQFRGLLEPGLIEDSSGNHPMGLTRTNQFVTIHENPTADASAQPYQTPSAELGRPKRLRDAGVRVNPMVVDAPPKLRRFGTDQRPQAAFAGVKLDDHPAVSKPSGALHSEVGPLQPLDTPHASDGSASEAQGREGLAAILSGQREPFPAGLFAFQKVENARDRMAVVVETPFELVNRTPLPTPSKAAISADAGEIASQMIDQSNWNESPNLQPVTPSSVPVTLPPVGDDRGATGASVALSTETEIGGLIVEDPASIPEPTTGRKQIRDGWLPARLTWWSKRAKVGREETPSAGLPEQTADQHSGRPGLPNPIEEVEVESVGVAVGTGVRESRPAQPIPTQPIPTPSIPAQSVPAQAVANRSETSAPAKAAKQRSGLLNAWFKR